LPDNVYERIAAKIQLLTEDPRLMVWSR
jgi:hypothetical protein